IRGTQTADSPRVPSTGATPTTQAPTPTTTTTRASRETATPVDQPSAASAAAPAHPTRALRGWSVALLPLSKHPASACPPQCRRALSTPSGPRPELPCRLPYRTPRPTRGPETMPAVEAQNPPGTARQASAPNPA